MEQHSEQSTAVQSLQGHAMEQHNEQSTAVQSLQGHAMEQRLYEGLSNTVSLQQNLHERPLYHELNQVALSENPVITVLPLGYDSGWQRHSNEVSENEIINSDGGCDVAPATFPYNERSEMHEATTHDSRDNAPLVQTKTMGTQHEWGGSAINIGTNTTEQANPSRSTDKHHFAPLKTCSLSQTKRSSTKCLPKSFFTAVVPKELNFNKSHSSKGLQTLHAACWTDQNLVSYEAGIEQSVANKKSKQKTNKKNRDTAKEKKTKRSSRHYDERVGGQLPEKVGGQLPELVRDGKLPERVRDGQMRERIIDGQLPERVRGGQLPETHATAARPPSSRSDTVPAATKSTAHISPPRQVRSWCTEY